MHSYSNGTPLFKADGLKAPIPKMAENAGPIFSIFNYITA